MRGEIKEEENRKKLFENLITEKILNLMKPIHSQIQAAYWDTKHKKYEETVSRYIIIKLFKISSKEKILKAARGKKRNVMY